MTFDDLGVPADLVAALAKQGISEPTPIQSAAIPVLAGGASAYLHAETGTGKTLAYLLPLLARLDTTREATQALIVAPTHELAIQIQRTCTDLAQHSGRAVRVLLLIGGTSIERQLDKLKKKPQVVVGSPGRVQDLIGMRKLKTADVALVVVDEADRLLVGESLPLVRRIVEACPPARQVVCASATEVPEAREAIDAIAPGAIMLRASLGAVNPNITHSYLVCEERDKPDVLRRVLHAVQPERAIVFAHRTDVAERVAAKLAHHGIAVADLHGASDKFDRKRSMDDFRAGRVRVLMASDVAARGLDIGGVSHVINLDVPSQSAAYLHRVGRTGRAGAPGAAITMLTAQEVKRVARLESDLGIRLTEVRAREGRLEAVSSPS